MTTKPLPKPPAHEYKIALTLDTVDSKWLLHDGHTLCVGDMRPSDFAALMQSHMTHGATLEDLGDYRSANWYAEEDRWYYLLELMKRGKITLYESQQEAEQATKPARKRGRPAKNKLRVPLARVLEAAS